MGGCFSLGGLSLRNESVVPILVVLSQLSPLHWARVDPGETQFIVTGMVWFTVSVSVFDENLVPTAAGVVARLAVVTAAAAFGGIAFAVVGSLSGLTSVVGSQLTGVFADGRRLVVRGEARGGGAYALRITVCGRHWARGIVARTC